MFAPKTSFIHVDDFDTVEKLAEYLNFLLKNESVYNQYFDWYKQDLGEYLLGNQKSEENEGLCKLCKTLHAIRDGIGFEYPVIRNLESWWNGDGEICQN